MRSLVSITEAAAIAAYPPSYYKEKADSVYTHTSFDTNIVIITAALLFVLICALGMNAIIRCAFNFTRRHTLEDPQEAALRRANTGINKHELKLLPTTIYHKESTQKHSNTNKSILKDDKKGSTLNKINEADDINIDHDEDSYVQDSQCPICLSDFQDGEKIRVLPKCKHGFHVKCVDAWLYNHSSCPTCRGDLATLVSNHMLPYNNNNNKRTTQVQLQIVISPSGTLTPTLFRVLPSQQFNISSLP